MSDDGRLTLRFPIGAAPQDVALSVVSVHTTVPTVAAYELRPVGASFAAPVTATWTLDPAGAPAATDGDLVWLGMARADDTSGPWAWLADPHVAVVDGDYSVTGTLSRFGTLVVIPLPTRIHGPEAIWGAGYEPGRGIPIDLDLTLLGQAGGPATSAFSGDQRFGGGYPERIHVTPTVAEADRLSAVWECLLPGPTSLSTTFGVREDPAHLGTDQPAARPRTRGGSVLGSLLGRLRRHPSPTRRLTTGADPWMGQVLRERRGPRRPPGGGRDRTARSAGPAR